MFEIEAWMGYLGTHGLWVVAILSILEGPIVTVVAAFLARQGVLDPVLLVPILVAGDLIGDLGFYVMGRTGRGWLPQRWQDRLGLDPGRAQALTDHFRTRGGRTLVLGKWTHSVGAAVLIAAGLARMPLLPFVGWNTLATIPKTLALMALGWFAGDAYRQIDLWLGRGALIVLAVLAGAGLIWWYRRRPCPQE